MHRALFYIETPCSGSERNALFTNSISGYFSSVFEISERSYETFYNECIVSKSFAAYDYIYIMNSFFSEFICEPYDFFDFMEHGNKIHSLFTKGELLGASNPIDIFNENYRFRIPLFFSLNMQKKNAEKIIMEMFKKKIRFDEISEIIYKKLSRETTISYFGYMKQQRSLVDNTAATVPLAFDYMRYLTEGFPLIYLGVYNLKRFGFLHFGTENGLSRLYEKWVCGSECNSEVLKNYIFNECDASQIKECLNLNFIVQYSKHTSNVGRRSDCAVFAHLYYKEGFGLRLEYLKRFAERCDVYISVDSEEKRKYIYELAGKNLFEKFKIILVRNRGRDISALLVGFRKYTAKYKYFCFLHDKKSNDGIPETIGRAFENCIWQSLLGSTSVDEIIKIFEDNSSLGLLVPPHPYWGPYLDMISDFWTVCYKNTLELANKLGLKVLINDCFQPPAIGNAFWCRREAIEKLLDHPWKYTDFDEEPLPLDGTISHSIERIYPYLAFEKRFLTGMLTTQPFLSEHIENYDCLVNEMNRKLFEYGIPSVGQLGVKGCWRVFTKSLGKMIKAIGRFILK